MNEQQDLSITSDPLPPDVLIPPKLGSRAMRWFRRFLACNPFYLVSAALLLFGFYRVSVDSSVFVKETPQLAFNYTSLQVYELLLVFTAIFLARRQVWYDSALLLGLENLLVLVPFILVSQAALIDTRLVWVLCAAGAAVAAARFGAFKRLIAGLNFPGRQMGIAAIVLVVNAALPIIYRLLHESKVGKAPSTGAAYEANFYAWVMLMPAICALANLVPATRRPKGLGLEHRWLPLGWFSLWLTGTGVHLYCLGYVYDFNLTATLLAPVIWTLLWTTRYRVLELFPNSRLLWRRALLVAPLVCLLLAAWPAGNGVFATLTLLNTAIYGWLWFAQQDRRFASHLFFISLVCLAGGLPESWLVGLGSDFSRAKLLSAAAGLYVLTGVCCSTNAILGMVGALVAAAGVIGFVGHQPGAVYWAADVALAFLLAHSLRWEDAVQKGARKLRAAIALAWIAHAFFWMHQGGETWMASSLATPVLAASLWVLAAESRWRHWVVSLAALTVMMSGPADYSAGRLYSAPLGLLAVGGSFLLFGLGTLAALTKHRWLR